MKKILYVTGSRAEYGIMKRLLIALKNDPDIQLTLVATGMHCDEKYGLTYKNIEDDGFKIDKLIDIQIDTSNNARILHSMAICLSEFGNYFQDKKFDAVMVLGDRYEIFSVAIAAAMHNQNIIHLHGGEQTLGNYDEFIRHSITKMAKLHLASTEIYRQRIIQLGEMPSTVYNIGSLGAENTLALDLPEKNKIEIKYGALPKPYFVVVFHPETLINHPIDLQVEQLLLSLKDLSHSYDYVFIGSNSDTGSDIIYNMISNFCKENNSLYIPSLLPEEYLALCKYSSALIGNSSSGIIEIPSLGIPTINIGSRQQGRVKGDSIIDCKCTKDDIVSAIKFSQHHTFKEKIRNSINPYYQKETLENTIKIIKDYINNYKNTPKKFHDLTLLHLDRESL
ncbi:MAG: UDP-N-acetylglucosamine 2-epimerase [Providencia rettgeri]